MCDVENRISIFQKTSMITLKKKQRRQQRFYMRCLLRIIYINHAPNSHTVCTHNINNTFWLMMAVSVFIVLSCYILYPYAGRFTLRCLEKASIFCQNGEKSKLFFVDFSFNFNSNAEIKVYLDLVNIFCLTTHWQYSCMSTYLEGS